MARKSLYIVWAVLFAICAALGFLPAPTGLDTAVCVVAAVLFFVPPAVIVYLGWKGKHWEDLRLVRNLALGSLAVTLLALMANFFSFAAPLWVGDVLYAILVIVSTPMICGQIWFIGLLLWAALLWSCILLLGKKK